MENLVQIELAYINTKHPDFHKDAALVSSLLKNAELNQPKQARRNLSNSTSIMPIENVRKILYASLLCCTHFHLCFKHPNKNKLIIVFSKCIHHDSFLILSHIISLFFVKKVYHLIQTRNILFFIIFFFFCCESEYQLFFIVFLMLSPKFN